MQNEFDIIQLISPGSQATFSITYTDPNTGGRRTSFPDLIALKRNNLIFGEVKPKYSRGDKQRLLNIRDSVDGYDNVVGLVSRVRSIQKEELNILLLLIHGDFQAKDDSQISQLVISQDDSLLKMSDDWNLNPFH